MTRDRDQSMRVPAENYSYLLVNTEFVFFIHLYLYYYLKMCIDI